ncbi:hypothetical protein HYY73_06450 [Candidatus Woesearchaeota archaeon]|nr:hypothetical protein [Candidatus Woesearchaeota archaeon]
MTLESIFGVKKPIIGMVHLADLYPPQGLDYVISRALADARSLHLGGKGVDALLVENLKEESNNSFVAEETVKRMSSVIDAIVTEVDAVIGVNVPPNDYRAAFRIAREQGLSFVQLDVYTDRAMTYFTQTKGVQFDVVVDPADVRKYREGTSAALFVNIHTKGDKQLTLEDSGRYEPLTESAKRAVDYGADGVVVTYATGSAPTLAAVNDVKRFAETSSHVFPVIVGSGMTPRLVPEFLRHADGAIVGKYFKAGGITDNPVDGRRVEEFMRTVRAQFR